MSSIVVNTTKGENGTEVVECFEVMEVEEENGDLMIPCPEISDGEDEIDLELISETNPLRKWQFKLAKRKKQLIKVKSRMRSCQLTLEEQDEQLKSLQEQIAKKMAVSKKKGFDWTAVKSAHLISKVFELCDPVQVDEPAKVTNGEKAPKPTANAPQQQNGDVSQSSTSSSVNSVNVKQEPDVAPGPSNEPEPKLTVPIEKKQDTPTEKIKCLYTADFHRFAIALYFFSPKAYFFLSNVAPMFPHRNYIRQWVTAGRVEKLFPKGVYRDEFNEP